MNTKTRRSSRAFTLAELLVAVSLIGLLAALSMDIGSKEIQRTRVNALSIELAGWLENVRRAALRGTSCTATINTGNINAGGTIATASASNCLPASPLKINGDDSRMKFTVTSTASSVTYTPRGSRYPTGTDITITLTLQPDGPSRCVIIRGLLGVIGLGKSSGGTCTPDQRF